MIFELEFVTYIRMPFGYCHVKFPYMELLSFFSSFVQKVLVSCFSDSLVQKTTQQSDVAVLLQVIPSFYTNYSKNSLFISANTFENYIVSKNFVLPATTTRSASHPNADITI